MKFVHRADDGLTVAAVLEIRIDEDAPELPNTFACVEQDQPADHSFANDRLVVADPRIPRRNQRANGADSGCAVGRSDFAQTGVGRPSGHVVRAAGRRVSNYFACVRSTMAPMTASATRPIRTQVVPSMSHLLVNGDDVPQPGRSSNSAFIWRRYASNALRPSAVSLTIVWGFRSTNSLVIST